MGGDGWNICAGLGPIPDQNPYKPGRIRLFDSTKILPTEMVIEFGHGGTR